MKYVAGVSAFYHDAACALLQDGNIIAAAQEERFTRVKHDPSLPFHAFMYCLQEAGITINDIDALVFYEDPDKKQGRQLMQAKEIWQKEKILRETTRPAIEKIIRDELGYEGPLFFADHHISHAASAYYYSGYEQAAILTADGVGEWATTTFATGIKNEIKIFKQIDFPHSLGLFYSTITNYLGFEVNEGEYKVMGLAPYGNPSFVEQVKKLVQPDTTGGFTLNLGCFDFTRNDRMYSDKMMALIGFEPRKKKAPIEQHHKDLARSLQIVLEETLLTMVDHIHRTIKIKELCMAGGVALNCVANGRIIRESAMQSVFIQPAANDAGGAIGAASHYYFSSLSKDVPKHRLQQVCLGPSYSDEAIEQVMQAAGMIYDDYRNDTASMHVLLAGKLNEGQILGWFQGRMEFGPRALGARSILADPRDAGMKDRINALVKKREAFRPFAPVVPEHLAHEHFEIMHPSPFMLQTCQVRSALNLPAITHIDGSARVQTVNQQTNAALFELLTAFDALTGCPILVNTSFNVKNEPIVCSPTDALCCFVFARLDILVMGNFVIERNRNTVQFLEFILKDKYQADLAREFNVYTFM
jgi:carbamoyltransferase